MNSVSVTCHTVKVEMRVGPDIIDITRQMLEIIKRSGVVDGTMHATVMGSTGSITTIEHEPGVVKDLKEAVNRLAPPELDYEHEKAWHDGNGHSHVQAALVGPSLVVPIRRNQLALGTWQQIVLINHDNRARQRVVEVTVIGNLTAQ